MARPLLLPKVAVGVLLALAACASTPTAPTGPRGTDGGASWKEADLEAPILSKAATRFRFDWTWNGQPASLASRCTDETGYIQPALDDLVRVRGRFSYYHSNAIKTWFVHGDGSVSHA